MKASMKITMDDNNTISVKHGGTGETLVVKENATHWDWMDMFNSIEGIINKHAFDCGCIDVEELPMYEELNAIMNTTLHISRTLARQTKERYVVRCLKEKTNIPLNRIKELVSNKTDNNLDLAYTSHMYLEVCDDNGYFDGCYGLDGLSDEGQQCMKYLEYWENI